MEYEEHKIECIKNNIEPLRRNDEKIFEILSRMEEKFDVVMPTIKELNNIKSAWNIAGNFGAVVVKLVISLGIIIGGIYAIRDWMKK